MVVWSTARASYGRLVARVRWLRAIVARTERRRTALAWWPGVLLTLAFVVVGLRGIDFGYHWDEGEGQLKPVREMVSTGVFLPRMRPYSYNYPSLCRYLVLAPAVPAGIDAAFSSGFEPERVQTAMLRELDAPSYLLRLRGIFLSISALAILWTFGAGWAFRLPRVAAFAAAAALACSWEFGYHARFVATDCIVTQFAAFTLFALGCFWREGKPGWLLAGAISAGLATGTKYTGIALLIPVSLAALLRIPSRDGMRSRIFLAALAWPLAGLTYLLTTPGTLLDPFTFITDLRFIGGYYAKNPHGGYGATSAMDHARIVFTFLTLSFFSPFRWLAIVKSVAIVAGMLVLLRRDFRLALVLGSFPLMFLGYFVAKYRLVTVRNYLFVTPFLALALGFAVAAVAVWLRRGWPKRTFYAALACGFAAEAAWLIDAAESIRHPNPRRAVRQALEYVAAHTEQRFFLGPSVRNIAQENHLAIPANVTKKGKVDRVVYFAQGDGPDPWFTETNDAFKSDAVFGPREVNLAWYATWAGHDHVLVVDARRTRAFGPALLHDLRSARR